jgi:hypothetical protein
LVSALLAAGCGATGNKDSANAPPATNTVECTAEKGPVKLSVRVWPREPRLSDLVEMDVRVESQPGVEVKAPAFGQAVGDFLVRDYTERPAEGSTGRVRLFHYQLEPAHAGKHLIRSVGVEFADKRPSSEGTGKPALIETEPLEINVTSEFGGGAPSLANLEPMMPPQPVSRTFTFVWPIALAAAGLLGGLVVLLHRRKRRTAEPRRLTPDEIAHAALAQLLTENLPARGLTKEFYLRLTSIVRQYVEDTTGIRAPEQTTEEFLRDMRAHAVFSVERSTRLAEFLEAADLVKYAGQQPELGQIDQASSRAQEFVNYAPASVGVPAAAGADGYPSSFAGSVS